jgi:methionyl-tRNA formyltransferase
VGQQRGSTRQAERGMKEIALERKIVVLQPESINTPEGVASLQALKPDLLLVAAYGQILSRDVLAAAQHGGINVHASLLPKYRGAAPIAWAIYHGETRTGVTIIRMSVHLDAGDILAQEAIDILPDETAGKLEMRLGPLGAKSALATVDRIAAGSVSGMPQDKSQVTKAPKLTKEHGLINWNRNAQEICNQIRAMQPWPTPYTFLHQPGQPPQRVIINVAKPVSLGYDQTMPAGTVIMDPAQPQSLIVAPGESHLSEEQAAVHVCELQLAGKRRMKADEFLRGRQLVAGARFGME